MRLCSLLLCVLWMTGCAAGRERLRTVRNVDLDRFMGSWYVIACIPTFIETGATNAVETYRRRPDGSIDTVFTFNKGSFDGPLRRYNPRGFVVDRAHNSTWAMRFLWPFKSEYLITYLDAEYTQTIIGRNKRDYAWIMARTPRISPEDFEDLKAELARQGYDLAKLRVVPQGAGETTEEKR